MQFEDIQVGDRIRVTYSDSDSDITVTVEGIAHHKDITVWYTEKNEYLVGANDNYSKIERLRMTEPQDPGSVVQLDDGTLWVLFHDYGEPYWQQLGTPRTLDWCNLSARNPRPWEVPA